MDLNHRLPRPKRGAPARLSYTLIWLRRWDLNPRPPAYETGKLTLLYSAIKRDPHPSSTVWMGVPNGWKGGNSRFLLTADFWKLDTRSYSTLTAAMNQVVQTLPKISFCGKIVRFRGGFVALVYCATNRINNKRYIGFTSFSLEKRKSEHIRATKWQNPYMRFTKALIKYGAENFIWEILGEYKTQEEGYAAEIKLISQLKPEYNMTPGGKGTAGISFPKKGIRKEKKFGKRIVCLETGQVFRSCQDAAESVKVSVSDMSALVCGRGQALRGFHFMKLPHGVLSIGERYTFIELIEAKRKKTPPEYKGNGVW